MRNVTGLNKYFLSKIFEYMDNEKGSAELIVEWTPKEGIKSYLETLEFELSFEQINDLLQIVAEEAYKMGKENNA